MMNIFNGGQQTGFEPGSNRRVHPGIALLAVISFAALSLVSPMLTQHASAADDCGSGFYKDSDGSLFAQATRTVNGRSATAKTFGYVRYCARSRTGADQHNQRVVVGVPNDFYATGRFTGNNVIRACVKASITVNAVNITSGSQISLGLSPGWTFSVGSRSVTAERTVCSTDRPSRFAVNVLPADQVITVPNCSPSVSPVCSVVPKIASVRFTSEATLLYGGGSTPTTSFSVVASDLDLS